MDLELLGLARQFILDPDPHKNMKYITTSLSKNNRWFSIRSGCFVTAYKSRELGFISENVWCCMSNGEYDGKDSVVKNVVGSAIICATRDVRRTVLKPEMVSIDVLVPRFRWRRISIDGMSRDRNRSIQVEVGGQNHTAIYLPSVWRERPDWTARDFIRNLVGKALNSRSTNQINWTNITIYEIDTYEITELGSYDYGYFNQIQIQNQVGGGIEEIKNKILYRIWDFYEKYAKSEVGPLAYLVDKRNQNRPVISYDNEMAVVRTLSDLTAYYKLGKYLGSTNEVKARNRVIKQIGSLGLVINLGDPAILANWIELLMVNRYWREICLGGLSLIGMLEKSGVRGRFDDADLSFGNPQAMLALLNVVSLSMCHEDKLALNNIKTIVGDFLDLYGDSKVIYEVLEKDLENSAFGANWLTQALSKAYQMTGLKGLKTYIRTYLLKILLEAIKAKRSVTQEVTSVHALLVGGYKSYLDLDEILNRWSGWQDEWGIGGFRYRWDEAWYRTDVTSHVVEVLLLL